MIKKKNFSSIMQLLNNFKNNNLISIVLFGSYITKKKYNDVDLLLIYKRLPTNWRQRDAFALKIENFALKKKVLLHVTLSTTKEITFSIKEGAPLMFGLMDNHKLVYDKNNFFKKQFLVFKVNLKKWNAHKLDKTTWEVPALAIKI